MVKKIAVPRIKLEDLWDRRWEEKAQRLEAKAKEQVKRNPAFSKERAAEINRADFRKEVKAFGQVKETREARRAQAIFKQLVAAAQAKCPAARPLKWKMAIIDDPEPDQGWAYGSGYIVITAATACLPVDAEIAATIAHEMGHVICGRLRMEWAMSELIDEMPAAKQKSARRAQKMILRRNELEADVFSVRLLKAAGFPPEAAIASLERSLAKDGELKHEYKRSHPTYARRIARLRQELKKIG